MCQYCAVALEQRNRDGVGFSGPDTVQARPRYPSIPSPRCLTSYALDNQMLNMARYEAALRFRHPAVALARRLSRISAQARCRVCCAGRSIRSYPGPRESQLLILSRLVRKAHHDNAAEPALIIANGLTFKTEEESGASFDCQ